MSEQMAPVLQSMQDYIEHHYLDEMMDEIEAVIDRCVVLDDGMIKEDITMDELNESGKDLRALLDPYRPAVKK